MSIKLFRSQHLRAIKNKFLGAQFHLAWVHEEEETSPTEFFTETNFSFHSFFAPFMNFSCPHVWIFMSFLMPNVRLRQNERLERLLIVLMEMKGYRNSLFMKSQNIRVNMCSAESFDGWSGAVQVSAVFFCDKLRQTNLSNLILSHEMLWGFNAELMIH